eukprot:295838-Pelagomonas_calceolata.AAC.4
MGVPVVNGWHVPLDEQSAFCQPLKAMQPYPPVPPAGGQHGVPPSSEKVPPHPGYPEPAGAVAPPQQPPVQHPQQPHAVWGIPIPQSMSDLAGGREVSATPSSCNHCLAIDPLGIAIASGIAFLIVVIIVVVFPSVFVGGRRSFCSGKNLAEAYGSEMPLSGKSQHSTEDKTKKSTYVEKTIPTKRSYVGNGTR